MFKQRALYALRLLAPTIILLIGCVQSAPAKHDSFLLGEEFKIKTPGLWTDDGESLVRTPLMQKQEQAIFALYLAPLLVAHSNSKKSMQDALLLIPDVAVAKNTVKSKLALASSGARLSPALTDSMLFLRWRLLNTGGDGKDLAKQIQRYLDKTAIAAKKQGAFVNTNLLALSLDYQRQQKYLDAQNLSLLASHFKDLQITKDIACFQIEADAVNKYEQDVAEAYLNAQMDRQTKASEHFGDAVSYLRSRPQPKRQQTDEVRHAWLRVLNQELLPFESGGRVHKLNVDARQKLKVDLNRLIDLAYLAKIDGRLSEAAFLFRRAFILSRAYFPEQRKDYAALAYDLGETLMWDEKYDESVYYFGYCLETRRLEDPLGVTTIDTSNLLGRVRLSQGQSKIAQNIFFDNLSSVAKRLKQTLPGSKTIDQERDRLVAAMVALGPEAGADNRRQIDDAIQGTIDSALPLKQYDVALSSGNALLTLREQEKLSSSSGSANAASLISVLWGLAYCCDSCARPADSIKYYSRLISQFGSTNAGSLPNWYHGRGVAYDQSGDHKSASSDIKLAIKLYKKKMAAEQDEGTRDYLSFNVGDLQYNLDMASKYPVTRPDYADMTDNCHWRLSKFPLKVFIDHKRDRGFGGELFTMVHEAVDIWRDYPGSPIKIEYVDDIEQADVFIERVTLYDDIPYGSAGRTSANFEHRGDVETKIITKAHIRVYCPTFDGFSWENQDVKMSSYAKIQFKYLLVHELGHVFGLAHSPAGPDIMFWKSCAVKLSDRDMNTVKSIYTGSRAEKIGRK